MGDRAVLIMFLSSAWKDNIKNTNSFSCDKNCVSQCYFCVHATYFKGAVKDVDHVPGC